MAQKLVLLGDAHSHGGVVIEASSSFTNGGAKVAMIGDKISCPHRGHGVGTIVEGFPRTCKGQGGRSIATTGDLTSCGATLIGTSSVVWKPA